MMPTFKNETGNHYGQWLVLERAPNKHGTTMWLCRCNCGKEKLIAGAQLRAGGTSKCRSCANSISGRIGGAKAGVTKLSKALLKPAGEAGFIILMQTHRSNALRRGHLDELNDDRIRLLSQMRCHFCGSQPTQFCGGRGHASGTYSKHAKFFYNGIDRYDNSTGYTVSNSVPCCGPCNMAKGKMHGDVFKELCSRVTNYKAES